MIDFARRRSRGMRTKINRPPSHNPVLLSVAFDQLPLDIIGRLLGHHPGYPDLTNEIVIRIDRPCPAEHALRNHITGQKPQHARPM